MNLSSKRYNKKLIFKFLLIMNFMNIDIFATEEVSDFILKDNVIKKTTDYLLEIHQSMENVEFSQKQDKSFVSNFEKDAEQKISSFLEKLTPWASFQGEEGNSREASIKSKNLLHTYKWYIDPIDGTISFKNGLPYYGMTAALVKNDHIPILSIVLFPKLNEVWYAEIGKGTYCNGQKVYLNQNKINTNISLRSDDYAFNYLNRQSLLNSYLQYCSDNSYIARTYTDIHGYSLIARNNALGKLDAAAALWDLYPSYLLIREAGGEFVILLAENPTADLFCSCIVGQHNFVQNFLEKIKSIDKKISIYFNKIPKLQS